MRWLVLGWLVVAACGERSTPNPAPPSSSGGSGSGGSGASAARVTSLWRWGATATDEGGPRPKRPTDPPPVGAVAIAAGGGKVVVATRAGCVELLDGATGAVVREVCDPDTWIAGLAIAGGVAIVARATAIEGRSLSDLAVKWSFQAGAIQTNQPLARPGLVDGRFCFVTSGARKLWVSCLEPGTGTVAGAWDVPQLSSLAFGERRIAVIPRDQPPRSPASPPGLELPIELRGVDGKLAHTHKLAGAYGPTLEQSRPIFVARGGGYQSTWSTLFLGADGAQLAAQTGPGFLRGGVQAGDLVLTSNYGGAGQKDHLIALRAPDRVAWTAGLDATGPWDPAIAIAGRTAIVTHDGVFTIDLDRGAIVRRYPIDAWTVALWRDRTAFLVEANGTRSDSNRGDAGVYAIDVATGDLVLRDDVGRDIAGGQLASPPVFDADHAYAIAGGRVHAYGISP